MIQINNLHKSYDGKTILNGATLSVAPGEVYGIVGGNGVGKTTLLDVIAGVVRANTGDIRVSGKDIRVIESVPNIIGYVQDASVVFEYMTGREYMTFLSDCIGLEKTVGKNRIDQLVEMFSMADYFNKFVETYSRGMKQRLSIASVLLGNPKIILMDEPTTNLDFEAKENLRDIILKMRNSGKTVIFTTNSLWAIENYCDRVGLLVKGKIMMEKSLDELRSKQERLFVVSGEMDNLVNIRNHFNMKIEFSTEIYKERLFLKPSHYISIGDVVEEIEKNSLKMQSIQEYTPSFKDVFSKESELCQL